MNNIFLQINKFILEKSNVNIKQSNIVENSRSNLIYCPKCDQVLVSNIVINI